MGGDHHGTADRVLCDRDGARQSIHRLLERRRSGAGLYDDEPVGQNDQEFQPTVAVEVGHVQFAPVDVG